MSDWKKDSTSEAKIVGALVGGAIGGGILAARKVSNMAASAANADQLRRCARRDEIAQDVIAELIAKLPRW